MINKKMSPFSIFTFLILAFLPFFGTSTPTTSGTTVDGITIWADSGVGTNNTIYYCNRNQQLSSAYQQPQFYVQTPGGRRTHVEA